jgi:hypothetical protein
MIAAYFFWISFLATMVVVLIFGTRELRAAIGIMIFGVAATTYIHSIGSTRWIHFNSAIFGIDTTALVMFLWLAFKFEKKWLMLVTGWQLAAVIIHLATFFARDLWPRAYGVGQGVWAYLQYGTMLIATFLEHNQRTKNCSQPSSTAATADPKAKD